MKESNWFSSEVTNHIVNFDNVVVVNKYNKKPFGFGQGISLGFREGVTIELYCEEGKLHFFYNEIKTFLEELKGAR